MLLYSIVVIAIIALSSIAFTYILHRHKPVDANIFIVIAFSSIFVLVLSLCFPFLFAAIINLASRTENTLRVIVGFSVILLIYILAISRFVHFIFMFLSENKNTRLQAFMDKINETGLCNYFLHFIRRKPISAVGRSGVVSAIFAENPGTSMVMEDIKPKEPERVCETEQADEEPNNAETITNAAQQDTTPDQPDEHTTDIISEAIDVINEESSLIDEEKPAMGIPEEIMQTLEEAATVDESVISDFDEYIKVASQTIDAGAEAAASGICGEAEDDIEELNLAQNVQEEIVIMASSQAEYQETVEIEAEPEEELISVAEAEEVVSEVLQDVSQDTESEVEILEDSYPKDSEEPILEQLETLITEEETAIPVAESYIILEEPQPEQGEMAVDEFEAPVYQEVAAASEVATPVEEQSAAQVDTVEASVDSYIDEAFRFKQEGDYESAILYYMYALDSKPEDSLVFWVILDICVLYKEMGQIELAKQILESYVELYGSVMDQQVRDEIICNLTEE